MSPNTQIIEQFYRSFQKKDYRSMAACYHEDATFQDEVFDLKNGREIAAMWHMLCEAGKDLHIGFSQAHADDQTGGAHWEAHYTFSRSGRRVHNVIEARFGFRDGKIVWHEDRFSFRRWSRMALGPVGWLLGWTPFLRHQVRRTAMNGLWHFIERHPEYQ